MQHPTPSTASQIGPVRRVPAALVYLFGALGAILWGYDTGAIAGAMLFIKEDFALSPSQQGLVTAAITLGAIVGSLFSATLVDRLGRRRLITIAAGAFLIGTAIAAPAVNPEMLVVGRLVLGGAVGLVAVNVPIYLAEVSPARIRGRVVSLTQLMISTGVLLAYVGNLAFSGSGSWEGMIAVGAIPAVVMLVGIRFLPESPRWLVTRGRLDEARSALLARDGEVDVEATIAEIRSIDATARGSWRSLLAPWARRPVLIAIVMVVLAQFLGINTITYYAPTVLQGMGFSNSASLITNVGFGIVSVTFTLVAMQTVDRVGRKPLLLAGAVVMGLSMLLLGLLSGGGGLGGAGLAGVLAVAALAVFKATFSLTWGPVSRVVEAEVLPLSIRGSAMSVAEVANFAALFLVSLTFPILLAGGQGVAFLVFAAMGAVALVLVLLLVPESKGRSLEDIETRMRASRR